MVHHSIRRFQDARVGLRRNVVRPEEVGGRLASTNDVSFILGLRASATCQRLVKSLISWFREVVLKRAECGSAIGRAREMPRSISRSPQRKGRRRSLERSPSPVSHRHVSRRSRREHRSRSPPHAHTHGRRKSWSLSPRHGKKRVSRSPLVHKSRSPSLLSSEERKWAIGRACEQEEKKRRRYEAELKLVEDETSKRVEESIRRKVQEALESDDFKRVVEVQIEEGRKRILEDISFQLEREKEDLLSEARRKEERIQEEKEELEKMLEDNRRKIEESQKRAAEEQARKEEERYKELEALQQQKEEHLRRKKLQDEQNRTEQMKILGKKNTRPKLSFALGSK